MPLAEDQHSIGEFGPESTDEPFNDTVRPWATRRNPDHADTLWVPNRSSRAVTCVITEQWLSDMIASRDGTTALSDLPVTHGLAGTAGP